MSISLAQYHTWMRLALQQAALAETQGDIPVGAVVIHNGEVIAQAHNRRELDHDPCGHAELLAMRDAAKQLGQWRLNDCILVVTLEPCLMCASALVQARMGTVVFGAADPQQGGLGGRLDVRTLTPGVAPDTTQVLPGVLEAECSVLLQNFFQRCRG